MIKTKSLLFLLCFISFLRVLGKQEIALPSDQEAHRPWLTIFVHGNYGSFLTALSFDKVLNDCYEKTSYLKIQQWLRNHMQFHHNRFLPKQGLHKVPGNIQQHNTLVATFAKSYNDALDLVDHQQATHTTYYTFGWNGLLCQKARQQAAIAFYAALSKEIATYTAQGLNPKVRIVCLSHGGNVTLNLAGVYALLNNKHFQTTTTINSVFKISQEISPEVLPQLDPNLCIDELILLASPIQVETEEFVTSSLFKRVYSFYSRNDIMQIIDFISTEGPISKHTIAQEFLKSNVMQIHYSVIHHIKPRPANPFITFIKKCIFALTHLHKSKQISKKQALTILLKSITSGQETDGILPAVERTIQVITNLTNIPEEKDFDFSALNNEFQAIQKNMLTYPHDPSHGDFVKTPINKKLKIVAPLPLFVWTPIMCYLLQKHSLHYPENTPHLTLYYHNKTITIHIEDSNNVVKKIELPEIVLLNLQRKFYTYLI